MKKGSKIKHHNIKPSREHGDLSKMVWRTGKFLLPNFNDPNLRNRNWKTTEKQ